MAKFIDEVRAARRLPPPAMARAIRVAAGVTQQRVADELDVHVVTVARWENGSRHPRGDVRARYAELLDSLREVIDRAP